jgi:CRISPR-associated protein Cas1
VRRHLNTLYVTSQGSYLSKQGETVAVRVDDEERLRIPVHNLESIVCFGNVLCSPFLLGHCGRHGVHLSFLSRNGRFLARVVGATSGNVLLRREQYRRADDDQASTAIARNIVFAKLANCRSLIKRTLRDHRAATDARRLERGHAALARCLTEAQTANGLDRLRGIEGAAGREYFACFDALVIQQRDTLPFNGRSRRPPLDPVNALLSFLYTLLVHDVIGALEGVGLDPQVGFLHRDRPGRPSLALDLMEELRPVIADRLTLTLINRRQVEQSDFVIKESGAVLLTDSGRKKVLVAYQKRKDDVLSHPYLREKTTLGLVPHLQALLLARYLRGDLDGYPAFIAK